MPEAEPAQGIPPELTEKSLAGMAGWKVFSQGRELFRCGAVLSATASGNRIRGSVRDGQRTTVAGLVLRSALDVENLCSCRDARRSGMICAHSIAVGLKILDPTSNEPEPTPGDSVTRSASVKPATNLLPASAEELAALASLTVEIEGSLREIRLRHQTGPPELFETLAGFAVREGFERASNGDLLLRGEDSILAFFASGLERWKQAFSVVLGERITHVLRNHVLVQPRFDITEEPDGWFSFRWFYSAGDRAVFRQEEIQKLLRSGKKSFGLRDGKTAFFDAECLEDLEEVLRDCDPRQESGGWRIPPRCAGYLRETLEKWTGGKPGVPQKEKPVPLSQILRPYQIEGVRWMRGLADRGFGGVLADDMGLGKTLQALSLIAAGTGTSLVVCPSSLVWNWRREAERFLPDLPVLAIEGKDRHGDFARIPENKLVITSYALLRSDLERYLPVEFDMVFLDEAQHIKNPDSQISKAVRKLPARSRFLLTGTPLENSLSDLWALFEFCLPAYLGPRKEFHERTIVPSAGADAPRVLERLHRRVKPFFLRRTKQHLLPELPEKIEQVLEVPLTPEQATTYAKLREVALQKVEDLHSASSPGAARLNALSALLRLRQACCDLRLFGKPMPTEQASAKLPALMEILEEMEGTGRKALVFSQFTSVLDLIENEFEQNGVGWLRLDGSLSAQKRAEAVTRFEAEPEKRVFLISLKAGGTGLNLTAADTVVHFDPWWNPAVEEQATARAHRMGQKQTVHSIKLITKDTIEERILLLQQKKKMLFSGVLDAELAWNKLDAEDIRDLLAGEP